MYNPTVFGATECSCGCNMIENLLFAVPCKAKCLFFSILVTEKYQAASTS